MTLYRGLTGGSADDAHSIASSISHSSCPAESAAADQKQPLRQPEPYGPPAMGHR